MGLFLGSLQYVHISPVLKPRNRHRIPGVASLALYKRGMIIPSLTYLVILCLMHLRMQFPFLAARTHCWLTFKSGVHQDPRSSCFPAGWPTAYTAWGCSFILNFALPLVELPEILGSPFLQTFEVPLDVTVTLWHISHFSSFSIMSKLAESTHCPNIWTINEDAKQKKMLKLASSP